MSASAFIDVVFDGNAFSIPKLKWRELIFIGAIRSDGGVYVRDPARPMPPFEAGDLFPIGARFLVSANGDRVNIERVAE